MDRQWLAKLFLVISSQLLSLYHGNRNWQQFCFLDSVCDDSGDLAGGRDDHNPATLGEPLYENAPICEEESLLLISLFATRHGLSDVALQNLLQLLALHCPEPNRCTTSLFRYKRLMAKLTFQDFHGAPDKKHVCGKCHQESPGDICINRDCSRYEETAFKTNTLITLPIAPQVSHLVSGKSLLLFVCQFVCLCICPFLCMCICLCLYMHTPSWNN